MLKNIVTHIQVELYECLFEHWSIHILYVIVASIILLQNIIIDKNGLKKH